MPSFQNEYGKRVRSVYIPEIFNNLPDKLFNIENISKVKKELKSHLLNEL